MKKLCLAMVIAILGCSSPPTGGCDPACGAGTTCKSGACVPDGAMDMSAAGDLAGCRPACVGITPHCNATGHCVSCLVDADCTPGNYCKIISDAVAVCSPGCMADASCPNGQKCCTMRCVDVQTDGANCGACGMACSGSHQSAKCAAGQCAPGVCDPGWGDCNKDPKDGCEANLHADPANCTSCGSLCAIPNAHNGCADGCYATACKFGFDDCNLNAMDGCETSVLNDVKNCGACGKSCTNLPNAMAGCVNGNCVLLQCTNGFADCDKSSVNGCEVTVATDTNNCGKCGTVCAMGNICKGGGCTCPMCNIPNASALCVNNMCVFDKCNPGFADCNNNTGDGCEVNLLTDKSNCNGCNMACQMGLSCANGMCVNSQHNTVNWAGFMTANNSCNMMANGVVLGNYQWLNMGMMTWKQCLLEASRRGAQVRAPSFGPWPLPGWFTHRNPNSNLVMTGQWANYITADMNINRNCILLVDPQSVKLGTRNNANLANSVAFDGNTWRYQDYGVKWVDECELLAGNAGASIITPATIGQGTGDNYWQGVLHTCSVYSWSAQNGTNFAYDNTVQRTSQKSCMVGYIDN